MHETAIVEGLMRILKRKASQNGINRIVSIVLRIGRLRGLDPRQIRGCFEMFAEGTIAEGAQLIIDEILVEACCRDCGQVWQVPGYRFECPCCGGANADVTKGRELYIDTFEGQRSSTVGTSF
jgi:hydrogenase nickel incorporation protein HypA/HybF